MTQESPGAEPGTHGEDRVLENLATLLIDGEQVEFLAAAIVRADEAGEPDPAVTPWSLIVTEPSIPLSRPEMDVMAVTRTGAIHAGRGRWRDQRTSRDNGFKTDLVEGIEELRVGDVSELGSEQHVTFADTD